MSARPGVVARPLPVAAGRTRIDLFGELRVEVAGRDVTADLPGRQGRALLAHLVLNHPRPVYRDELLGVLWPSAAPVSPDAALRSVLAKVRRAIGPGIVAGRELLALVLPAGAEIDAQAAVARAELAERALAEADHASALDAARSVLDVLARPLLPWLEGDWVESWRGQFADVELRALSTAAGAALGLGGRHLATGERAARAVVEREPYREGGYGLLMRTQAQRGDVAEALRTFERLRVLLREELGIGPSPQLVALHEELLREGAPAAPRAPGAAAAEPAGFTLPPVAPRTVDCGFVGREDLLGRLRTRWHESRGGQTRLVVLVGEAGVGKTRLASHFAEEVHREGGAVLYGRADEDALLPHQPFVEALQHLLGHGGEAFLGEGRRERDILSRLLPDLRRPADPVPAGAGFDEETLRYQLFEAVVVLLTRASRTWPVLLVLDDLHWADKPTLLLLRHLLRHPQLSRLLVVGTFRHVEVGPDHALVDLLTDLRRERRYDRFTLDGLDESETQALAADRLGTAVTPGFVQRLREQTDGNAFFIEETLRTLVESGVPSTQAGSEEALRRLGVPEGVAEVIVRRLRNLSPLAAEVLTTASVIGRTFRLGVVEQLVDGSPEAVMSAVEEAMVAGLLVEAPDRVDLLSFPHALVREVLYRQLTASRRVRVHHRVAKALEDLAATEPVNPAELALHFHLARHLAGSEPARRYAVAAGRRAADLLAYEEAVGHFGRALALLDDGDEAGRCEVLLALGGVQWHAGADDARRTFLAVAQSAARRQDADQLARAALGLGQRFWEAGYAGPRHCDVLEQAAEALGPGDGRLRALVRASLAQNLSFPDEDRRADALSREALAMARRLDDDDVLFAALSARHVALLDVRHLDERLDLTEELLLLDGGHRERAADSRQWRMYALLEAGDADAAHREQVRLDAFAKELGQPLFRGLAAGWRGLWAELDGDLEAAAGHAEECLRHGREAHAQDAVSGWTAMLFRQRRRQGRLAELAPAIERLARTAGAGAGWAIALGLVRADAGDEAAAREAFDAAMAGGPDGVGRGIFWVTRVALLSELCAHLGDADGAAVLYGALAPYAHRHVVVGYSSFWGPVDGYLALLAQTRGEAASAARHAHAAAERTRAMHAPLLTQELEARHGSLLRPPD